ncbi:MAG: hypothetical protein Tp1102MES256162_37 [Prokaryotic dsDNA virus sp.]|jgi:hypothetical protein|nr:MAG: hypothetical protein Tp1102MES256162_37 [Prokaryotic dsDNA virus sp.]|tara:strand:+ start:11326 stop:11496 length:171 start_codon:yes stop_codon:yes gene_type:complete
MVHLSDKLRNINLKVSRDELNIIQDLIAQRIGEDKNYNLVDEELIDLMHSIESQTM